MKPTQNELDLLVAIATSEFIGVEPINAAYVDTWVDCVWGWEGTKKYPGTLSSLVKKELAGTDGEGVHVTAAGLSYVLEALASKNEL